MLSEPVEVTLQIARALESLGISYVIDGSMASTAYGHIRTTMDVDIVAEQKFEQVQPWNLISMWTPPRSPKPSSVDLAVALFTWEQCSKSIYL